jgi:hypothetical protein
MNSFLEEKSLLFNNDFLVLETLIDKKTTALETKVEILDGNL